MNFLQEISLEIFLFRKNFKWAFFYRDRNRVLSDPRYRPPTPVLVDSEVRGTTLQKLIVDSEVRGTTLQKLIVSEVSEVSE